MREFRVKWTFVAPDLEALETPHGCLVRHPNGTEMTYVPNVRVGKRQGDTGDHLLVDSAAKDVTLQRTDLGDGIMPGEVVETQHYRHAADAD